MTSLHPDVDELVFLEPTPEETVSRGRGRRVAVLGTALAVGLTAVGVLSVQGVRTADAPAQAVVTASPSAAALQTPVPLPQAPASAAAPSASPTAAAPSAAAPAGTPAAGASGSTSAAARGTAPAAAGQAASKPAAAKPATAAKPAPQPAAKPAAAKPAAKPAPAAPVGTAGPPVAPAQPAPQSISTSRASVTAEKFGARGDGVTDDTAALQKALDSVPAGSVLQLRAGATYLHSDVLRVSRPDIVIAGAGATVMATDEARSSVHVTASRVQVTGVTFGLTSSSRRWDAPAQDKVRVWGNDVVLREVKVQGAAAAGIFIDGAARFLLDRVTVSDSRADGIHMTRGARDGRVVSPVTNRTGDDGVAVVSYKKDGAVSARISITSPVVNGTTWGRGISVVGGTDISYTDVRIKDTDSAAVYLGSESEYDTYGSQRVLVSGGTVSGANRNSGIDHGAVLVTAGNGGTDTRDITVQNLAVTGTRSSADANVNLRVANGATVGRVSFTRLALSAGPGQPFRTALPQAVRVSAMTNDGAPVTDRLGW